MIERIEVEREKLERARYVSNYSTVITNINSTLLFLDELERGEVTNFKYKIGQQVYFRLHELNCVVERQLVVYDISGMSYLYDLAVVGKETRSIIPECFEDWIDDGHRIE